jgi:hypothetical protein
MKCRIIKTQLIEFVRNELDNETRRTIETHLSLCAACREKYETTKLILSLSNDKQPEAPSDSYWVSLLPRIRARIDAQTMSTPAGVLQRYLVPLAAAIVLIVISLHIVNIGSTSNLGDTRYILQQVPETELQEFMQKLSIVGIHETKQPERDSILTNDDGVVVSDLLSGEISVAGYIADDPVFMYETISNRTANEIVSIIASKNL